MTGSGPFEVVSAVVAILDELDIDYALGGSMAASVYGEPRSTADIDVAVDLDPVLGEALLSRVAAEFYVPVGPARTAIESHSSFNLIPRSSAIKVDLFALGDGLLDRRQIECRVPIQLPGVEPIVWVTSPEDMVLRKLDWYRLGGMTSERQWRDVLGVVRVLGADLDRSTLRLVAGRVGLERLLEQALAEGTLPGPAS